MFNLFYWMKIYPVLASSSHVNQIFMTFLFKWRETFRGLWSQFLLVIKFFARIFLNHTVFYFLIILFWNSRKFFKRTLLRFFNFVRRQFRFICSSWLFSLFWKMIIKRLIWSGTLHQCILKHFFFLLHQGELSHLILSLVINWCCLDSLMLIKCCLQRVLIYWFLHWFWFSNKASCQPSESDHNHKWNVSDKPKYKEDEQNKRSSAP